MFEQLYQSLLIVSGIFGLYIRDVCVHIANMSLYIIDIRVHIDYVSLYIRDIRVHIDDMSIYIGDRHTYRYIMYR